MTPAEFEVRFRALLEAERERCLWFLKPDYRPTEPAEQRRVLETIQKHCGLQSFKEAGALTAWLSQSSSVTSAVSSPSDDG